MSTIPHPSAALNAIVLRDGARLAVRPVGPGDKQGLDALVRAASPEDRRLRFFTAKRELTPGELVYLTEIDHDRHEALVAIDPRDGAIAGVARYVVADAPEEAEAAVFVADEWQGRGLGRALVERLADLARTHGIRRLIAVVMAENTPAIRLFAGPRKAAMRHGEPGTVTLVSVL